MEARAAVQRARQAHLETARLREVAQSTTTPTNILSLSEQADVLKSKLTSSEHESFDDWLANSKFICPVSLAVMSEPVRVLKQEDIEQTGPNKGKLKPLRDEERVHRFDKSSYISREGRILFNRDLEDRRPLRNRTNLTDAQLNEKNDFMPGDVITDRAYSVVMRQELCSDSQNINLKTLDDRLEARQATWELARATPPAASLSAPTSSILSSVFGWMRPGNETDDTPRRTVNLPGIGGLR